MNPRTRKEIRSLLPAFFVTVSATIMTALIFDGSDAWSMVSFVFGGGCVMMGAASFGNEFYTRTMTSLLAQPISRKQLWAEKLRVLGGGLALAYVVWLFSVGFLVRGEGRPENHLTEVALIMFLVPVIVYCSAPLISLLAKNIIGSMALTAILPFALWLIILAADYFLSRLTVLAVGFHLASGNELFLANSFEKHVDLYIAGMALGYSVLAYQAGTKFFLKFESLDSPGTEVKLPARLEAGLSPLIKRMVPGYTRPFASLVRKELGLQRLNFIMAGLLCAYLPFAAAAWALHPSEATSVFIIFPFGLYVLLVPLLTGILCVAEERNLGTANWQFTLPPAGRMQWGAKMLVALLTCLILGVVLPLLLAAAWAEMAGEKLGNPFSDEGPLLCLSYLFLFSLVIYASSISSNAMRATLSCLGLVIGAAALAALIGYVEKSWLGYWYDHGYIAIHHFRDALWKWVSNHLETSYYLNEYLNALAPRVAAIILGCFMLWLLRMASQNFCNGELNPRRTRRQMSWIMGWVALFSLIANGLIFVGLHWGDDLIK